MSKIGKVGLFNWPKDLPEEVIEDLIKRAHDFGYKDEERARWGVHAERLFTKVKPVDDPRDG